MTLQRTGGTVSTPQNPCELQIDLFCLGVRTAETGRGIRRTRAGLGSGIDLILPGSIWVNAPVTEPFAARSPYVLRECELIDERSGTSWTVSIPDPPAWYAGECSSGRPMAQVGILQGTYLGIYIGPPCEYWRSAEDLACRFCTTGRNVSGNPVTVEEVVETAQRAKQESDVTFVHLNTGYQGGRAGELVAPFVEALKREVGVLVGVQIAPEADFDRLIDLGADHFSFCYEIQDPARFAAICPGKERTLGQEAFFDALRYCQSRRPRGACSGEIIAGLEPVESTIDAIDMITSMGAFPTVCIFRPLEGSAVAHWEPPDPLEMRRVMKHVWESCRDRAIPIGMARNLEVSLVVQPTDAAYLADNTWRDRLYKAKLAAMRPLARWKLRRASAAR
ncbi:MAG: radical SAM protein [Planctomycetota bacterium]|jgi:hypothetical protein